MDAAGKAIFLLVPLVACDPLGVGVGVPALALVTSSRHFLTIALASFATSGSSFCLKRFTMTPILVERNRSSDGLTPVFSSFRILTICPASPPVVAAFPRSFALSATCLASMTKPRALAKLWNVTQRIEE